LLKKKHVFRERRIKKNLPLKKSSGPLSKEYDGEVGRGRMRKGGEVIHPEGTVVVLKKTAGGEFKRLGVAGRPPSYEVGWGP